jgi:hypothetical protein
MLLNKVFEPFVSAAPVCVMARGVLENILDPVRIDVVFEAIAERQYTRDLAFSSVVDLMSQVVLGIQPSVHAAYRAMAKNLGVSDQSGVRQAAACGGECFGGTGSGCGPSVAGGD